MHAPPNHLLGFDPHGNCNCPYCFEMRSNFAHPPAGSVFAHPPTDGHFWPEYLHESQAEKARPPPREGAEPVMNDVSIPDIIKHALCDVMVTARLQRSSLQKLSDYERKTLEGMISSKRVESLILHGLRYEMESKAAAIIGDALCALDAPRRRRARLEKKTFEEMFGKRAAKALKKAGYITPFDLIALDKKELLAIKGIGEETADDIHFRIQKRSLSK